MRRTKAEVLESRVRELTGIANTVKGHTLAPEMDADARALYWVGPGLGEFGYQPLGD
jgi:hypothetical protein